MMKKPILQPSAYYIRITTKCNNRCVFCNVGKSKSISFGDVLEAIQRIPENTKEVVITGGEPCIDRNMAKYIQYIRSVRNVKITIQTNAIVCAYPNFAKKLEELKINKVIINYPAHNLDEHRRLTGNELRYVHSGLDNLFDSSIDVVINYLINSNNYSLLPDFALWLTHRYGSRFSVFFTTLIPSGGALSTPEHFISYSEIIPYLRDSIHILLNSNIKFIIAGMYGIPLCILGDLLVYSENYMYLNPNCHAETGEDMFVKGKNCSKCRFDKICTGVWKYYAKHFGLEEINPIPFYKLQYPRLKNKYDAGIVSHFRSDIESFERGIAIAGNYVVWSITQKCNCKCSMCVGPTGKHSVTDMFTLKEIDKIFAEIHSLGFHKILFCGGEPTLVQDLPNLIGRAKAHNLVAFMNTNALILSDVLNDCLSAGLDCTVISLDSPKAEIHDKIRGVNGLHKKAIQCAKLISKRAGPQAVRFHTVIMNCNYPSLVELPEFAYKYGVNAIDMTLVMDALGIDRKDFRLSLIEMYDFYWRILPEILSRAYKRGIQVHISPLPFQLIEASDDKLKLLKILMHSELYIKKSINKELHLFTKGQYNAIYLKKRFCSSPYRDITIDYDGTVYPCGRSVTITSEYKLGNLRNAPLSIILNNDLARRFRLKAPYHPVCKTCISYSKENEPYDCIIENPELLIEEIQKRTK